MSARDLYAELGIDLPTWGGDSVNVRCFADPGRHKSEDRKPSCEVKTSTGHFKCHGCGAWGDAYKAALAVGKSERQAAELVERHGLLKGKGRSEVVEAYDYTDEEGGLLFQVVRFEPKDFRQRRPNGAGGWEWKVKGTRPVVYRLPAVVKAASRGERVWVVEGERDVHALEKVGQVATTCPGGAGKWRAAYAEALRGAHVVVVADRDHPGRKHAREVAASLEGIATSVDVVEAAVGSDVSDHLAAGKPLGELVPIHSFHSTPRDEGERNQSGRLPFASLGAALANAPAEPEWRWDGYLAPGVIALLAGRPKVGKSTLLFGLMASLMRGQPFLELPTRPTGVLLLSEEREGTLKEKEARFGLEGEAHLLMRHQLGEVTWAEAVVEARAYCRARGLGVLVVDTFAAWAGLRGDEETKPGAVLEALVPLQEAAADGLSVLLVAHQRKAAGAYGEAVRGSNALAGGVDVIVEIERPPADAQAEGRARVLHAVSRYSGTPEELALELTEEGYRAVGDVAALRGRGEIGRLREVLLDTGGGTIPELAEAAGVTQTTTRRRLDEMLENGEVERQGSGNRGDPFRYVPRFIPFTPSPRDGMKRNESGTSENPHPNGQNGAGTLDRLPAVEPNGEPPGKRLLSEDELIERLKHDFDAREIERPQVGQLWFAPNAPREKFAVVAVGDGTARIRHELGGIELDRPLAEFDGSVLRRAS